LPAAIDTQVKKQVITQWLSGDSRDRIAADNGIGAGTVSNIINDWKKGVEDSDYDSLRELAVYSKKEGFGLTDIASSIRLINYIQKLGVNQDQIETFIANLVNSPEPEKLVDVANQIAHLSRSESIPLEELGGHVKQKEEEKQRLEDEIKQRRAILESANVEIQTIIDYKQLKAELSKHNLSLEEPERLVTVLNNMKHCRYDPKKIVAEFARLNSLRRSERILKNNCEIFENRMSEYKEVLPHLLQIRAMGIGIDKLSIFSIAVNETAQKYNLSISAAAYRVIEDIENYNRIGGMKNEISNLAMQRYAMKEICAPRNKAITSLLMLQNYGITDDEILNVFEFLNRVRFESEPTIRR
jgi:5'-3' exonuclease